ncbi:helix-turn-helix domain-containing protein [Embleya sp. NPDC001921]
MKVKKTVPAQHAKADHPEPPEFYSTADVARMFKVDPATVRGWRFRNYGPGPWVPVGRKHLVRAEHVHAWLDALEAAGVGGTAA